MNTLATFEKYYVAIKQNRWYSLFALFCRFSLAFAFIAAGLVKLMGERFANGLSVIHPMGAYLEALHHTGYYYTWIGLVQVLAAILLLIPRTVSLGALLYFPIILNICILSYALRFVGSIVTSPLMVLANVFLLVWNYDKLRYLLPMKHFAALNMPNKPIKYKRKFPLGFFTLVLLISASIVLFARYGYEVMPENSYNDCYRQFEGNPNESIGAQFCECIHQKGDPLNSCLEAYEAAKNQNTP